ncbi:MAG: response regulator [Candidatus Nomurabacteria bacterium]|nr:MAG: response regulator [Candidatus Nomurabacteria bacterium]
MQDQEDKQKQENEQDQFDRFGSQDQGNNEVVDESSEVQEGSGGFEEERRDDQSQSSSDSNDLHDMYDRHEENDQGESNESGDNSGDTAQDSTEEHSDVPDGDNSSTVDGQYHQEDEQPVGDTSGKKILLVEDDEALAAVYRSRLELEGFEIHEVHNGEEALQAAKEIQPDLLLLDAMMPKISGFDVLDILRHTPETANIRVIMLTALSQPKDKEKAETLGVDDYLVKSQVVIGDVVERVKHHLGMTS